MSRYLPIALAPLAATAADIMFSGNPFAGSSANPDDGNVRAESRACPC